MVALLVRRPENAAALLAILRKVGHMSLLRPTLCSRSQSMWLVFFPRGVHAAIPNMLERMLSSSLFVWKGGVKPSQSCFDISGETALWYTAEKRVWGMYQLPNPRL